MVAAQPRQLQLFSEEVSAPVHSYEPRAQHGTFQDSLRAPIHRWFTYPAGFSFKAVENFLREQNIAPGMVVYDPFAGTGTTNIVASQWGIRSYGVEAHPFVYFVAATKLFWNYEFPQLYQEIDRLVMHVEHQITQNTQPYEDIIAIFPEL